MSWPGEKGLKWRGIPLALSGIVEAVQSVCLSFLSLYWLWFRKEDKFCSAHKFYAHFLKLKKNPYMTKCDKRVKRLFILPWSCIIAKSLLKKKQNEKHVQCQCYQFRFLFVNKDKSYFTAKIIWQNNGLRKDFWVALSPIWCLNIMLI